MKESKDIGYIHILRIIACFLVIVNHTHHYMIMVQDDVYYIHYCIGFSLCKMAVTLFIMISAILMLDKEYSYSKVLQLVIKVIVPLLVLTLYLTIRDNGIQNFTLWGFAKKIISGPYLYPYWYVYMLIGFYVMLPFLQKMVKNFRKQDYIIFIMAFLMVPCLNNFIYSYWHSRVSEYVFWSVFPIIIGIAVAGNYIAKIKHHKIYFAISVIGFLLAFAGMFISCYIPYCNTGKVDYKMDSWSSLPVVVMACTLVYIVRYVFEKRKLPFENIIKAISKTTFGVYLFHSLFMPELYKTDMIQNIFYENRVIGTLVLEISVFMISVFLVYILEKIPFIKRFI